MTNSGIAVMRAPCAQVCNLMARAELPPSVLYGETEIELSPYRGRTAALLRRYARASVQLGRLPSLLGREFFRTRVTSYTMRNFEDVVIFVTDMEKAIDQLGHLEKRLLAMNILEEYTVDEVARLLAYSPKTIRRLLPDALDQLSQILLTAGLMDRLVSVNEGVKSCQGGEKRKIGVSDSKDAKYKHRRYVHLPPSNLIS
jgi:hypothetical protein